MVDPWESFSADDLDGNVPQEIVERRLMTCKDYQSEIRSVETSTTVLLAVLALYAVVFSDTDLPSLLSDFTNLGVKIIGWGFIVWIVSLLSLIFVDVLLSREISYLNSMLDCHAYGIPLPNATSFFHDHRTNKFSNIVIIAKNLGRVSPILLLVGLSGLYKNAVVTLLSGIIAVVFILVILLYIYYSYLSAEYAYLKMFGWKGSTIRYLNNLKHLTIKTIREYSDDEE